MRSLLHLAILFLLPGITIAQEGWTVYDADNGDLGTGPYGGVVIDASGNIWAGGGYKGVSKFNGTTWTHYTTFNSDLPTSSIVDMAADEQGNVWVAHYEGLTRFSDGTVTNFDDTNTDMPGGSAYMIEKAPNGDLWIATSTGSSDYEGLTVYDGNTWTNLTGYPSQISNSEFPDIAFANGGVAWIAGSGITKYSGGAFTFYPYATTGLWNSGAVAVDDDGTVWAGGFAGLLKYNGSWSVQLNTSFGFPENVLYYCMHDDGNYLWIGTSQGLLKYNRISGLIEANYKEDNSPLATNGVFSIAQGEGGNLWLSTMGAIVEMDPDEVIGVEEHGTHSFTVYPNPSEGLVHVVTTDAPGNDRSIEVLDVMGRKVLTQRMNGTSPVTLDLSNRAAGSYVIQLRDLNGVLAAQRVMLH